jgi:hypothetical protein
MDLTGLLAEPDRAKAFAAVALGARSAPEVSAAAAISAKDTAIALRRLADAGAVVDDGGLQVDYGALKHQARERSAAERAAVEDASVASPIRPFVRDGRLVRLPAQLSKKRLILEHIVRTSFASDAVYDETTVNAVLRPWCEGGVADHVTIRRYLVDLGLLERASGTYRVGRRGAAPV